MRKLSERQKDLVFAGLQGLLLAAGLWLFLGGLDLEAFWYDEAFTANVVRHSWPEVLELIVGDFSPPLYFLLLKLWVSVAGSTSPWAVRSFSVAAILALAALGATLVRSEAGRRAGVAFTLLVVALPGALQYAQESRMYAIAAFGVTAAALCAKRALRTGRTGDWILYCVATAFAMYTHYYAVLAALIIGVWTFVFALSHGRRQVVAVLAVAAGAALLFSPWIIVCVEQAQRGTASYWLSAPTLQTGINMMLYPFGPKFAPVDPGRRSELLLVLLVGLAIAGVVTSLLRRRRQGIPPDLFLIIVPTSTYFAVILGGALVSLLLRPIMLDRYIIPASGLLLLGAAVGLARLRPEPLGAGALVAYLGLTVPRLVELKDSDRGLFNGGMKALYLQYRDKVRPDDVFVHSNEQTFGTGVYYFPANVHLFYSGKPFYHFSNYAAMLPQGRTVTSLEDLRTAPHVWNVNFIGDHDQLTQEEMARLSHLHMTAPPVEFSEKRSWFNVSIAGFEPTR